MDAPDPHHPPRARRGSQRAPGPDQHARVDRRTTRRPPRDGRTPRSTSLSDTTSPTRRTSARRQAGRVMPGSSGSARRGPRSASSGTRRSRAGRRTNGPCGRSTRSSTVAPGWSSGRRSPASKSPIVTARTTRRARRWRARPRRSSRRSRRARAHAFGSARTTAAAGSSRTRRARDSAAGATCRPAATARRCGASARGAVAQTVRPRRPARPPRTPRSSRAAA